MNKRIYLKGVLGVVVLTSGVVAVGHYDYRNKTRLQGYLSTRNAEVSVSVSRLNSPGQILASTATDKSGKYKLKFDLDEASELVVTADHDRQTLSTVIKVEPGKRYTVDINPVTRNSNAVALNKAAREKPLVVNAKQIPQVEHQSQDLFVKNNGSVLPKQLRSKISAEPPPGDTLGVALIH